MTEFDETFRTPPDHVKFHAKRLFGAEERKLNDGAIAYLEPGGGGPSRPHTHAHDHLFIVTEGVARIELNGENVTVRKNESFRVRGSIPHSVWNAWDGETVMIGLTLSSAE